MFVELLISSPKASIFTGLSGVVVVLGEVTEELLSLAQAVSDGVHKLDVFEDAITTSEEGTILAVELGSQGPTMVRAWRSMTSNYEVFYLQRSDRSLILADSFRSICASLPVAERVVSERAIVDHLLFRVVPGRNSYLSEVSRLGFGERLCVDILRGKVELAHLDLPSNTTEPCRTLTDYLDAIESVLGTAISRYTSAGSTANLLSGGSDSTLVHTFLTQDISAVTVTIDSPEFARETEYAKRSSQLLRVSQLMLAVKEVDYATMLDDTICALALPPHHLQTVLLDAAFRSPQANLITGEYADVLFGLGSARHLSLLSFWRPLLGLIDLNMTGYQHLRRMAQCIRLPIESLDGPAMRFGVFSNVGLVEKMMGRRTVEDSFRRRLEYVIALCPWLKLDETELAAHLELGHWTSLFTGGTASLWRQLAHSRGRRLAVPFATRSVVRSALAVPRELPYVRQFRSKHLLKAILKRRLPSYPVNCKKLGSGLPLQRFLARGPLRGLFSEYAMPDFVPAEFVKTIEDGVGWVSWNCLTYAIWRDRVLRDSALRPSEGTRAIRIPWRHGESMP